MVFTRSVVDTISCISLLFLLTIGSKSIAGEFVREERKLTVQDSASLEPVPGAVVITGHRMVINKASPVVTNEAGTVGVMFDGNKPVMVYASGYEPKKVNHNDHVDSTGTIKVFLSKKNSAQKLIDERVTVIGVVADNESGLPLSDAQVLINNIECNVDEYGVLIHSFQSDSQITIKVRADNYFDTSIVIRCQDGVKTLFPVLFMQYDIRSRLGSIKGIVIDSITGTQILSAKVFDVMSSNELSTDSTGMFISDQVLKGKHTYIVSKDGYTTKRILSLDIKAGDTVIVDTIKLSKPEHEMKIALLLKIVDEKKNGIRNAQVLLRNSNEYMISDDSGFVSFKNCPAGVLELITSASGYDTSRNEFLVMKTDSSLHGVINLYSSNWQNDVSNGIIEGTVIEQFSNALVNDIRIETEDKTYSAKSDKSGHFTIRRIPAGGYPLYIVSDKYYQSSTPYIIVNGGEKTDVIITVDKRDVSELQKSFVSGKKSNRSTAGLLQQRKESLSIGNQLGAIEMGKNASGNAAEAMRYIPGLTIVDDKYAVIRGMSDRFVSNRFEGVELPNPNPDRVAFNYNLFPSGILDNVGVVKTYLANYPGNFSAGLIDVKTREIPTSLILSLSGSIAGNTQATFQKVLVENQGKLDWLGFDDGTRAIPEVLKDEYIPIPAYGDWRGQDSITALKMVNRISEVAKSFNTSYEPRTTTASPDISATFTLGKGREIYDKKFGILGALNYSSSTRSYENGDQINWEKSDGTAEENDSLVRSTQYHDSRTTLEYTWIALLKSEAKLWNTNTFNFFYIYTRNAEDLTRYSWSDFYKYREIEEGRQEKREFKFTQRGLNFFLLKGEHSIGPFHKIQWKGNISDALQDEPDYRVMMNGKHLNEKGDSVFTISGASAIFPTHTFRTTTEFSKLFSIDHSVNLSLSENLKLSAGDGVYLLDKKRRFTQKRYIYEQNNRSKLPEECGTDVDLWVSDENVGLLYLDTNYSDYRKYKVGNTITWDKALDTSVSHTGTHKQWALYCKLDATIFSNLVVSGGVRYEPVEVTIKSRNPSNEYNGLFNDEMLLYSAGVNYAIRDNIAVKFAFSKTSNLPSYREIAPYNTVDPVTLRNEQGNPGLKMSEIFNTDLRFEWYFSPGQIIALSLFYKHINDPIDKLPVIGISNGILMPQNNDSAKMYGCELEGNLRLEKISPYLENWVIGGNVTFVKTNVYLMDTVAKILERKVAERPLPFSSPYVINFNVNYVVPQWGLDLSAYFNLFGPRLVYASNSTLPDCYEFPRPLLNATASKKISQKVNIKLVGKNLLNTKYRDGYTLNGKRYYNQVYTSGVRLQMAISYTF